jgi:hypothetical protein
MIATNGCCQTNLSRTNSGTFSKYQSVPSINIGRKSRAVRIEQWHFKGIKRFADGKK